MNNANPQVATATMPEITLSFGDQNVPEVQKSIIEPMTTAPEDNSKTEIEQMEAALSPESLRQVEALIPQIDVTQSNQVLLYGSSAQKKIADFSDETLSRVKNADLGDTGEMLTGLIGELEDFSPDTGKFAKAGKWKLSRLIKKLRVKYDNVAGNVESIVGHLEDHRNTLMQDMKTLEELYAHNQLYFKELSMYILAGKKRLAELRETTLEELRKAAEDTSDQQAAMAYKDFFDACERFEKKLHDLLLSRTVAMQMAAQIRLLQNNDHLLTEKIQSTIHNTIPLWKSQMVVALGIANSISAMNAQRSVTDMTNNLLRANAQNLKQGTIEVARESERGIIDIETLVETNKQLIDTINEVQQIQADGRDKRRNAEIELTNLERELKQKLLEA